MFAPLSKLALVCLVPVVPVVIMVVVSAVVLVSLSVSMLSARMVPAVVPLTVLDVFVAPMVVWVLAGRRLLVKTSPIPLDSAMNYWVCASANQTVPANPVVAMVVVELVELALVPLLIALGVPVFAYPIVLAKLVVMMVVVVHVEVVLHLLLPSLFAQVELAHVLHLPRVSVARMAVVAVVAPVKLDKIV